MISLTINTADSKVHVVPDGLFLETGLFKEFSNLTPSHASWTDTKTIRIT